jgi:branched-subunit amino acid permease
VSPKKRKKNAHATESFFRDFRVQRVRKEIVLAETLTCLYCFGNRGLSRLVSIEVPVLTYIYPVRRLPFEFLSSMVVV